MTSPPATLLVNGSRRTSAETVTSLVDVQEKLMSLTLRMVTEYPDYPAGSVMRCVARAVRRAFMAGTPREQIPARVEHAARRALAGRHAESLGARRSVEPERLRDAGMARVTR